jgi:hypothetical protein
MSKSEHSDSWTDYIKNKKQHYHDESIRLKTLAQTVTAKTNALTQADFCNWMGTFFHEFEELYEALEMLMQSDEYAINLTAGIVGCDVKTSTEEEVTKKIHELGDFSNILIQKKKDWEAKEKERERLR